MKTSQNVRILVSSILGFILAIPLAMAGSFSDVDEAIHKNSIQFLKARGIVQGYSDGTYRPTQSVNRAEFLKILVESKFKGEATQKNQSQCFSDVETEWFAPYICYAKSNGIINGYSDGSFKPAQAINLAEALKIVLNTYDIEVSQTERMQWYEPYTTVAEENDWLSKIDKSVAHNITRGEMAELIYSVVMHLDKKGQLTFAEKLASCTPYENTIIDILTLQDMQREILGTVNGKCKMIQKMLNGGEMNCEFDDNLRATVAEFYEDIAEATSYSASVKSDSSGETKSTYTIDGVKYENPLQEALDTGACTILGYE